MSELPQGWAEATVLELAGRNGVVTDGDWVESKDQDPSGSVRLIQLADIGDGFFVNKSRRFMNLETVERLNCTQLQEGDVLIARMPDPLGRACIFPAVGQQAVTAVDVFVWRPDHKLAGAEPRWLMHAINSPVARSTIQSEAGGTTRQRVAGGKLKQLRLPVPPLPEQRRIVAKVDGLIARTARARKELDRIPALIARYKQRVLALAFSGELTAFGSSRPKVKLIELGDIVDISSGYGFPKDRQGKSSGDFPFAKVSDISHAVADSAGILASAANYVDREDLKTLKAKPVAAGSVVFAKIGEALKLNRRAITSVPLILDNNCMALTPNRSKVLPAYLLRFMETVDLGPLSVATAIPSVRRGDVASLQISLPSLEEQADIVRSIESAFGWLDRIAADQAAAARLLPRLDTAILAKAFRGTLVPQDSNDEPASVQLERIRDDRDTAPKAKRERKPNRSKAPLMTEKTLPPRDRLLKDSEKWPMVGLPFEAIAMRNSMPHDTLRDALFELLSGPTPLLQQRFDTDAEVITIQRIPT